MKTIHIQIQPEKDASLNENIVIEELNKIGINPEVSEGNDDGRYINYDFKVNNTKQIWERIKNNLLRIPSISNTAIICLEGENGWDDYLLLHHFDKSVKLDEI